MRRHIFGVRLISLIFTAAIILQPFSISYAQSGAGYVEKVEDGITIRRNLDGSKTMTIEITDEQIEQMQSEDSLERLKDKGNMLVNEGDAVDTEINSTYKASEELVTVEKDDLSISIIPIVDKSKFNNSESTYNSSESTGHRY